MKTELTNSSVVFNLQSTVTLDTLKSTDFQMYVFCDSIILLVFVKQFSQRCNIERMKIIYLLF